MVQAQTEALSSNDSLTTEYFTVVQNQKFQEADLNLVPITEDEFNKQEVNYIRNSFKNCDFGYLNLTEETECDEICETYLIERESNRRMYLPCNYDAGIIGASFSPNCNQLIVCSTYDNSYYDNYYNNRAEIYLYQIVGNDGLNSLKSTYQFSFKEWSIDHYVWMNNSEIGLMLYSEDRSGDGRNMKFQYFKASIVEVVK